MEIEKYTKEQNIQERRKQNHDSKTKTNKQQQQQRRIQGVHPT